MIKKLQLLVSALVVIGAAFFYGGSPEELLPLAFEFEVLDLDLKNIFRSLLGLYLAFAGYWLYALYRPQLWRAATWSNVLFMGGLGFGRLLSYLFDGYSGPYFTGMLLEFGMMAWGLYNLRKE